MPSLLEEQPEQAAEAYRKLKKTNPSDAATGLADLAVYEGRFSDAVRILESGAAEDMARTQAGSGRRRHKVVGSGERSGTARSKRAGARRRQARARTQPGVPDQVCSGAGLCRARRNGQSAKSCGRACVRVANRTSGVRQTDQGEAALKDGDARGAVKLFTDANICARHLDRPFRPRPGVPGSGGVYRGRFRIRPLHQTPRRGPRAVFGSADLRLLSAVYYYQGRAREGMKSAGFADSYKKYLEHSRQVCRGSAGRRAPSSNRPLKRSIDSRRLASRLKSTRTTDRAGCVSLRHHLIKHSEVAGYIDRRGTRLGHFA